MGLPSILIPYPLAADDHQLHNAAAFADSGAAFLLEQKSATSEKLASLILRLVTDRTAHANMSHALAPWHQAKAAELIAERMLALMGAMHRTPATALATDAESASRRPQSAFRDDSSNVRANQQIA
jgi:UDP-N-acetylglucosamine--N-acetylmuramyl-(pentapeptide) pyrophosphoryl-undecaprenol N-acetylglucosamine transferase